MHDMTPFSKTKSNPSNKPNSPKPSPSSLPFSIMEEFSFPTTVSAAASTATGFDSPPLWHHSPAASPIHLQISPPPPPVHRRSFSHAAEYTNAHLHDQDGGRMIKMDMLWEDFNEELSTSSTMSTRSKPRAVYPVRGHRGLLLSPPRVHHREIGRTARKGGGSVDVGCGGEGRLRVSPKRRSISSSSNTNRSTTVPSPVIVGGGGSVYGGSGTPARMVNSSGSGSGKPGLVVLIKVLKRLFLLHHHHHHHAGGSRRPSPPVKVKINRSSW